jgi:hypothetical protein
MLTNHLVCLFVHLFVHSVGQKYDLHARKFASYLAIPGFGWISMCVGGACDQRWRYCRTQNTRTCGWCCALYGGLLFNNLSWNWISWLHIAIFDPESLTKAWAVISSLIFPITMSRNFFNGCRVSDYNHTAFCELSRIVMVLLTRWLSQYFDFFCVGAL